MSPKQRIAQSIPSETRVKILMQWLPLAIGTMACPEMEMLFEAWYLYVEPNGIKKPNCQICVNNILDGWKELKKELIEAEQNSNALEQLLNTEGGLG